MNFPYELRIGLRYTRVSKNSTGNGFISFIALLSMIGIALGVAALIVVLSVMNGFQRDVRDKMLSVLAHVEIFSPSNEMAGWKNTMSEALRHPAVIGAAPYFDAQALLSRGSAITGVMLRGIDPTLEPQVSMLLPAITPGALQQLQKGSFNLILGATLADNLGVGLHDKVTVVAPQGMTTPAGMLPRFKQFTVAGIFRSGHFEFDSALALLNMEDAQILYRQTAPTGIRLKLKNIHAAPQVANELSHLLTGSVYIRDWTKQNSNWFAAVQIEKRMMFLILTLIIAVAAFNLISSLVMTVTDKQSDIAILRTLGAQSKSIMTVFFIQGITIGITGTVMGMFFGVILAQSIPVIVPFIESIFHVQFLPPSVYFINELPSQLLWSDVVRIATMALGLSMLATLYPSWRASRVKPAEALRYE